MISRKFLTKNFWNKEFLLILVIVAISFAIRAYNLSFVVGYDFDQEYASMFANSVVNIYPIQMIGQGLSVQGLFMGPWYFYFLVPFFMMSNLHPIGGYFGSIILGMATIFTYFYLGKIFFGTRTGIVLAMFRGLIFSAIIYDWSMASAYASELVFLLTIYFLYKFWHGSKKSLLAVAFLAGLYTSIHPILFPVYGLILLVMFVKRKYLSIKFLLLLFIIFLIPIAPLIRFEYYHNFLGVKQLLNLGVSSKSEEKGLFTLFEYIKLMFTSPYNFLRLPNVEILRYLFSFVSFGLVTFAIVRKVGFWKDSFHKIVLTSTVILCTIYYFFLPIHTPEYYFIAASTIILLYSIATVMLFGKGKYKKLILIFVGLIILFFNLQHLINQWKNPLMTLGNKDAIVKKIVLTEMNQEYGVNYEVGAGWQYGYGELFRYYNKLHSIKTISNDKKNIYTISSSDISDKGKHIFKSGTLRLYLEKNNNSSK